MRPEFIHHCFTLQDSLEKVEFDHFQFKSFSLRPWVIMLIFNGLGWPSQILAGQ